MRLKRWGIALSIVWFLAAGYWGVDTGLHKGDFAVRQFDLCVENSATPGNAGACLTQFDQDYPQAIRYRWPRALIVGIVPVGVAWLLVLGWRGWARRRNGFKPV